MVGVIAALFILGAAQAENVGAVSGFHLTTTGVALIAAVATAAAAAVTAWMACETRRVATATRNEVATTKDMVAATQQQAQATAAIVAETQRDRDLQWRPALSVRKWETKAITGEQNTINVNGVLHNAGGGPALGVRFLAQQDDSTWCMTEAVNVGAGETTTVVADQQEGRPPPELFKRPVATHDTKTMMVLFCRDALDHRYRFPIATDPKGQVHSYPVEPYTLNEPSPPDWVTSPILWPR